MTVHLTLAVSGDVLTGLDSFFRGPAPVSLIGPDGNPLWFWDFFFLAKDPEHMRHALLEKAFGLAGKSGCPVYEYVLDDALLGRAHFLFVATEAGLRERADVFFVMNS